MRLWICGVLAAAIGVAACGGKVTVPCDPGPCGGSGGNGGNGGNGGAGGGSSHAPCGGISSGTCSTDELCHWADMTCGMNDTAGECLKRPTVCPLEATPGTCGCDGMTYNSACAANAQGIDVAAGTCF